MNNLKKIIGLVLVSAIALVHFDSFAKNSAPMARAMGQGKELRVAEANVDAVIEAQTAQVQQVTADAEKVKMDAQAAIEAAQDDVAQGKISRAKAAVIIGEQKYAIKKADETLTQVTNEAAEKVAEAEGYLSRFVTGVKSWYYGPEEAREVARARVTQLEEDLLAVEDEYTELIKNARGNRNKSSLKAELEGIKVEFKNEIQKQNDIAEGRMSSQKFWRAVGVAGAVVGSAAAYGAYRYFGGEAMPPVSVTGTLEPKIEEPKIEQQFDTPPTMEDIKAKAQNIYQTGQQRITALGERVEEIRTQLPTSSEKQIKLGQGRVEELQAEVARKRQAAQDAQEEAARLKEAREQNERDIADKNEAKRQRSLTEEQMAKEEARTPEQKKKEAFSRSGAQGMLNRRTENRQAATQQKQINAQLSSTNRHIKQLEEVQPQAEIWAQQQQAKLDNLRAEKEGLKGSALTRKSRAIVEQEMVTNKANETLNSINKDLESSRAKAAELQ